MLSFFKKLRASAVSLVKVDKVVEALVVVMEDFVKTLYCSCVTHVTSEISFCFSPGYIYNFASSASKKLSESVAETAQTLKKSVEEGKINGIIDKVYMC